MIRYVTTRPLPRAIFLASRPFVRCSSNTAGGADEADIEEARKWLARLDADTIRHNVPCDLSFSRSSGPGGQNVNKYVVPAGGSGSPTGPSPMTNRLRRVSSKATLRISTHSLLATLPKLLHPSILHSRYHAAKSSDLVIQADDSRKQTDNVNMCFRKLHDLIVEAGKAAVPGETSQAQMARVRGLEKADKARTRKTKIMHSQKKSARRGRGDD